MLATAADVKSAIPGGDSLPSGTVDGLLAAADAAAKSYLRRVLEQAEYRERIPAEQTARLMFVSETPVAQVLAVNVSKSEAFTIYNTGAARASVSVTETGLSLREFYGGAWIPTALPFSTNATLSAMRTAIEAVSGLRWHCSLSGQVTGAEPSDELASLVGPIDVSGSKPATFYVLDGTRQHEWDFEAGSFHFTQCGVMQGETVLVRYVGGLATIPADVTKAVAMIAAEMYAEDTTSVGRGMKREKLGNYEGERDPAAVGVLSPAVCKLLAPWRRVFA